MPKTQPKIDLSFLGKLRSGIGGLAVIFISMMVAICVLIWKKPTFSDDLFLIVLFVIVAVAGCASYYLFFYGVIELVIKWGSKTENSIVELMKPNQAGQRSFDPPRMGSGPIQQSPSREHEDTHEGA